MPWYFAYGSNLNTKRLRDRVGNWQEAKKGILENYELTFDSRGFVDAIEKPSGRVFGALYLLTAGQLNTLDKHEGVHRGIYRREVVKVRVNRELVNAIAYLRVVKTPFSTPSTQYLKLIITGLKEHGFDETVIEEVKKVARAKS